MFLTIVVLFFYYLCCASIGNLILHFFNTCLDTGFWQLNKVSIRCLRKVSSDRRVCLTCLLGNVLKRMIDERLRKSRCIKLEVEQGGLSERRSTINYLQQLIIDLKAKIASTDLCLATFYDLEKALD